MSAPRVVWSRRFPSPQIGSTVSIAPPRHTDVPLLPPTNKQIPGVESLDPQMVARIMQFTIQQGIQQMTADGNVFGPGGAAFSGDSNIY